jgi:hypothetical protein
MEMLVLAASNDALGGIAAAGTTQGTAKELNNALNEITTVAANSGVILASKGYQGDDMYIFNAGANPLNVYPPVGMRLNALPLNTPMVLPVNTGCAYLFLTLTRVMAVLSA